MQVSFWFLVPFAILWLGVPVTQALFLVAPRLHHRLGMTEDAAFEDEYRWFLLDEKAIAIADMSYLVSGAVFIGLALAGSRHALPFGLYSCGCYVYVSLMAISRWRLLGKNALSPISSRQAPFYTAYMLVLQAFGLGGLVYLWRLA